MADENWVRFTVIAWRMEGDELWDASCSNMSLDNARLAIEADKGKIAEIVEVSEGWANASSIEKNGPPEPGFQMAQHGWVPVYDAGMWRQPSLPEDISDDDFPIVWLDVGAEVAEGSITSAGYYVEKPCHRMCCPPDGPFVSKAEAMAFLKQQDR